MPSRKPRADKKENLFWLSLSPTPTGNREHMTNQPSASIPVGGAAHGWAKWFLSTDDVPLAVPAPLVRVSVIKAQASVGADQRLVRDHNSPNDVLLGDDQTVDLREGNVFYTLAADEAAGERSRCELPAKRAMLVDDRVELIGTVHQTGRSLRELFALPADASLFRDLDTPHDEAIADDERVEYQDGPVFYSRRHHRPAPVVLSIIVIRKTFTAAAGVKEEMPGLAIAALGSQTPANTDVYKRAGGGRSPVGLQETIRVATGDEFDVIRKQVQGGFEPTRIERELGVLRAGGAAMTFHAGPPAAVVYHDLPVRVGNRAGITQTDVLVLVPGGYPAQGLDGAYLPQGSRLLGLVPGAVQHTILVGGRPWTQVSYHPHQGGGGPPWSKDRLGFHTYIDELLAWLDKAQ